MARRALNFATVLAALTVLWEGSKALFGIPTYKLPHIYEIFGEFARRGGDGRLMLWILGQNAVVTGYEAVAGFLLGAAAGFGLAIAFAHSRLLERGLLPYAIASQTVPILAIAPMVVVWLGTSWVSKAVIAAAYTHEIWEMAKKQ